MRRGGHATIYTQGNANATAHQPKVLTTKGTTHHQPSSKKTYFHTFGRFSSFIISFTKHKKISANFEKDIESNKVYKSIYMIDLGVFLKYQCGNKS